MYLFFAKSLKMCLWGSILTVAQGYHIKPPSFTKIDLYDSAITNLEIIRNFGKVFDKTDYTDVLQDISRGEVDELYISPDYTHIISVNRAVEGGGAGAGIAPDTLYDNFHKFELNPLLTDKLIDRATDANVHITITELSVISEQLANIKQMFDQLFHVFEVSFPFAFLGITVYFFLSVLAEMPPMPPMSPSAGRGRGRNRNRGRNDESGDGDGNGLTGLFMGGGGKGGSDLDATMASPNVSLASWTGSPEVIDECREIISYLENKAAYARVGAEMPKGILFEGPPGTGKTLLAKAIATETNSTFISMSGSEFVELFVGMGAARVRELFDDARDNRPAIIFIDEIDAIGKQRGSSAGPIGGGNDEREQTLNQLLYEMDGFNDNTDLIVLAATNRKDILDKALLRPGRFDRIIRIPTPDRESRVQILDLYLKNKPTDLGAPLNATAIAELTDGFSGAELKNLVNEAAILAARNNHSTVQQINLFDAFEKSIVGLIRKNATIPFETQRRVAVHEIGHTLMVLEYPEFFDFQKVSIQPTYDGAGGYTLFSEKPEIKQGGLYTKSLLKMRLAITMGGKAAESLVYGADFVSMGAVQDLNQANQLAKRMVGNFGMGRELEVFYNVEVGDGEDGHTGGFGNTYSEDVKRLMDSESLELVREAFETAKTVIGKDRERLDALSNRLISGKVLYRGELTEGG